MALLKQYSLGTMMFAWRLDKTQSCKLVASAIDNDITLMDTSVSYARGASHAMLSEVVRKLGCAKRIQIATKVGGVACDSDPPEYRGLSAYNIRRQCDLSLRQLGVDTIDLLQLHFYDSSIPLEQQVEAIQNLQSIGKIKAWGVCNYSAQQMKRIYQCAGKLGGSLPISNQVQYNILENKAESDQPIALRDCQMQSMVWGALSSGLLTNRTAQYNEILAKSRIGSGREKEDKLALLAQIRTQKILSRLIQLSEKTGASVAQLAISWVKRQGWVNTILLGPSSCEQFIEILNIKKMNISPGLLDGLVE